MTADPHDWCQAITDTLLPEHVSAGRPTRLNCDDEAIAAAAGRLGIARAQATGELVRCLHVAGLVDARRGVQPLARSGDGEPPVYVLGLAVLALAASRMASDELGSMAAYYRRLGELLGVPLAPDWPQVRGVPELVRRFDDLADWLRDHEQGSRGMLDLPADVHPSVVGVPIHQSLLRAGDRITLGAFFERTSRLIDAGWDPVHQLACWGGRHQLTAPLQTLLAHPQMHAVLAGALRAARHAWDGATVDATGRRLLPGQLALHLPPLPFTLSVTVPALTTPLTGTGPGCVQIRLDPRVPDAVPLGWLTQARDGPVIIDGRADTGERVRVLPGPMMLFEVTPLGISAVAAAAENPVWVLTCKPDLIATCADTKRLRAPLPAGWVLLCDVEPDVLHGTLRVARDDEQRPLGGIGVIGGLRLAAAVWLLDHPPQITADVPEPAPVTINGHARGDIDSGRPLTLDVIAGHPGVHRVEVGEQELTVELVARGKRDGVGTLGFDADPRRVHAGAQPLRANVGQRIIGPLVLPTPVDAAPASLIVRYRATVDVIDDDGSVRSLGPPTPAAWLDHVGLPQDGPWEIPDADHAVWLCVDVPARKFVVAHRPVDVPLTDDVLGVVEWFADAQRIIDRSDGHATRRWQRLLTAIEDAA